MSNSKAVRLLAVAFCVLGCLSAFGLWKIGELAFRRLSPQRQFRIQRAQAQVIKQARLGNLVRPTPAEVAPLNRNPDFQFLYGMQWRAPNTPAPPGATRRPFEICYDYFPEPWSSTQTVEPDQLWKRLWCLYGGQKAERRDEGQAIRISQTAEPGLTLKSWPLHPAAGDRPALRLKARADQPRTVAVRCGQANGAREFSRWTVQLSPEWNEWALVSAPLAEALPVDFAIDVGDHPAGVDFAELSLGAAAFQESPWRLAPHVIERRYNAHADRDRDYSPQPAPGTLRIVCLGDSFTEGAGVRIEETFAKQLEIELAGEGPVESLNGGVNAANPSDYAEKFLRQDILRSPHVVIVTLCRNDYETSALKAQWREEFGQDFNAKYRAEQAYALDTGFLPALDELAPLLERCRQEDIQVVLCAFQTDRAAEGFRMDQDAAQFARQRDIPYYNPAESLIAADLFDDKSKCSRDEWHPNREVHRLLAVELAKLLRDRGVIAAVRARMSAAPPP